MDRGRPALVVAAWLTVGECGRHIVSMTITMRSNAKRGSFWSLMVSIFKSAHVLHVLKDILTGCALQPTVRPTSQLLLDQPSSWSRQPRLSTVSLRRI
jgi:hypothetical protein